MLEISRILSEIVEDYLQCIMSGDRDCRLIVPGLTNKIAQEIHEYLINRKVNSFLVVGGDEQPNEEKRWIRPVGLTSKRIGTFIAVVSPGQLAHIQDSIRGSGGAIRLLAYSEEWPWIDNGSESFRFNGPVLDRLVERWTTNEQEKKWIKELILDGFLKSTSASSKRAEFLLENLLGAFSPKLYISLSNICEKILFHVGIPCPGQSIPDATVLIRNTEKLCQKIIERRQKEDDIREQVRNMVPEVVSGVSLQRDTRESIDVFMDGLGMSNIQSLGLLTFYPCWGNDRTNTIHWKRLTAKLLEELFGIMDKPKVEFSYKLECARSLVSDDYKVIATFIDETLSVKVKYKIPAGDYADGAWTIELLNHGKNLVSEVIQSQEGEVTLTLAISRIGRYSKKITLRIALINATCSRYDRFSVHLCGEDRPAFIIIEPGYEAVDATLKDDEIPDKKIEVDDPVHLYLFNSMEQDPEIQDDDGKTVSIVPIVEGQGIWKTSQRVDPFIEGGGLSTRVCTFGDKMAVLSFEARDIEKGEFTLEDELRLQIASPKDKLLKEIITLFSGERKEPYMRLGKMKDAARHRIELATLQTSRLGWRPLLTDLLKYTEGNSGSCGDFINYHGNVEVEVFCKLSLPENALVLLNAYSDARDAIYNKIRESVDSHQSVEHPLYASHPIYIDDKSIEISDLISNYLGKYIDILTYIETSRGDLEWAQLFVLVNIDCVVHWDNKSTLKNMLFLVGPWHPLILAKRFMVQAALFTRANRVFTDDNGKEFRQLAVLLERVQGFRWLPGVSSDDRAFSPIYVSATSDPGWHLGFKTNIVPAVQSGFRNIADICDRIREIYGLESDLLPVGADGLASSCLSRYMRAFPSHRTIGLRVCSGYSSTKIVQGINKFIHGDEGPTIQGLGLPGGVHLYVEASIPEVEDVKWTKPALCIYEYPDNAVCLCNENPDIYMMSPEQAVSFRRSTKNFMLPRGKGLDSVFFEPLGLLTEGQAMVPNTVSYEFNAVLPNNPSDSLGDVFISAVTQLGILVGTPVETVRSVNLPLKLDCPWVVAPGGGLDPAIFVQYVRDGIRRAVQERALWDYRIDLTGQYNSYYILSTIPKSFMVAVNGVFNRGDVAVSFIEDLGRIGIAIGGEALKSGRHALGVVGLVGAVRLFLGIGSKSTPAPLHVSEQKVGFILPIDSFMSFFGRPDSSDEAGLTKRSDLLAIQLILPNTPEGKLQIYACSIESKFVTGTFSHTRCNDAITQAQATLSQIQSLIMASLDGSGTIPERLGVLSLLRFGLRIVSPSNSNPREIEIWAEVERKVFEAILQGQYEYKDAKYNAVLVSTEIGLNGVCESNIVSDGIWIRLNRDHWPGIAESPQLDAIRQKLGSIFESESRDFPVGTPMGESSNEPVNQPSLNNIPIPENPVTIPVQVESPIPVIPVETTTSKEIAKDVLFDKILIGVDESRRIIYYDPQSRVDPLDNLNIMVTGSSGTGKTQFLKYLICKLREQGKNVLILDFKNDFASDRYFVQRTGISCVSVNFDGLPYNPLIPYPIRHPRTGELFFQPGQHIAGVANVLRSTYGLGVQQESAVKNAIVDSFSSMSIPSTGSVSVNNVTHFPDFSTVGNSLQNSSQAAYNRLDPLFTLSLFRDEYRDISFQALVGQSVILDLSQMPSDEMKNALAQLIVMSAHSYYNTQVHSGIMRQVLIFDEAHRVLDSEYMLKIVRECRAYGVGVILSSQYPSDFPKEISASLATKIIHWNGRDNARVRDIVGLLGCEGQEGAIQNLDRFQAFIDNRHNPHTMIRTMNYPAYLLWKVLCDCGISTRESLMQIEGIDFSKLSIGNLIMHLERLGLVEERDGQIRVIAQE